MRVRRLSIMLVPPALILGSLIGASPVLAAPCDGSTTSLGNGDFETPVVPADTYVLFPAASVPPWQTTDGAGEIELWGTGFLGVPAFEGNAFAELNANTAGTLYQDVVSTSGEVMTWSLAHRGREGDDVMQVLIGDANVADVNGTAGWDYISPDLTDGVDAWGIHTDQFVVPTGQTCTRLAFRAVVAGSGNDSIGNFLDAVAFAISIPPDPEPTDPPAPDPSNPPAPDPSDPPSAATAPPTDSVALGTSSDESDPGPTGLLVLTALAAVTLAIRRLASRTRG
jgi:hypothetical protein